MVKPNSVFSEVIYNIQITVLLKRLYLYCRDHLIINVNNYGHRNRSYLLSELHNYKMCDIEKWVTER